MLLELYECPTEILNDQQKIEAILVGVVDSVGATLINTTFHKFSPYGVSGVLVIAESHITIHSWPEHRYAAIDVFTCNDKIDYQQVETLVVEQFKAANHKAQTIMRGEIHQVNEIV